MQLEPDLVAVTKSMIPVRGSLKVGQVAQVEMPEHRYDDLVRQRLHARSDAPARSAQPQKPRACAGCQHVERQYVRTCEERKAFELAAGCGSQHHHLEI